MLARVTFGLVLWTAQASGRGAGVDGQPLHMLEPDSARIVRAARSAQADFEQRRRANLPVANDGRADHCEAHVGRFCYWHDGTTQPRRVDEPGTIIKARERLLAVLDSLAGLLPTDGWIIGQRVRYLLEADRGARAIAVARTCAAERWWCLSLEGLALHEAARFGDADSTFALALGAMPAGELCTWSDLSLLLDGDVAGRYDRASCADRRTINERIWWLAQPFYSLDGNDFRTEHYARRTMVRISESAAGAQGVPWGDDMGELIIRYGWPRWFTRGPAAGTQMGPPSVTGHDPEPSFAFVPDLRLIDSAMKAQDVDWDITSHGSRTNYAPAYATAVHSLTAQVARFLRGDSVLVVAAYDASRDTLLARQDLRAALVLAPNERTRFQRAIAHAPALGTVIVMEPRAPALVSIELIAASTHTGARARFALAPLEATTRVTLSDVLIYDSTGDTPRTLAEAVNSARASTHIPAERPLGLYWEMYGLRDSGEPIRLSLTIERTHTNWWLNVRRAFHLAGSDAPIVLAWRDAARSMEGVVGHAVAVDLSRLSAGQYRLRIELTTEGGQRVATEREFALDR